MHLNRRAFGLSAVALATGAKAQTGTKPDVRVFAAASLQTALRSIAEAWKTETGKTVAFSFAASSTLTKQLEQGAPADLFASADLEWMDFAEKEGLIVPATRQSLLGNRLVLISAQHDPVSLKITPGFDLAGALGEGRLATGNPASVPVGKYAQAALTNLGIWSSVQPKLAATENARAALALVARGEAKLGIVYATDARSEPKVRVIDTFPAQSHPAVIYPFAAVKGPQNPLAAAFMAYLRSPAAIQIFEAEGFTVLK